MKTIIALSPANLISLSIFAQNCTEYIPVKIGTSLKYNLLDKKK